MYFGSVTTFPKDIHNIFDHYKDKLIKESEYEIAYLCSPYKDCFYNYPTPIKTLVENQLKELLPKYTINAFHCTKLVNINNIISNGLKVLSYDKFKNHIINTLTPYLSAEQKKIAQTCIKTYNERLNGYSFKKCV